MNLMLLGSLLSQRRNEIKTIISTTKKSIFFGKVTEENCQASARHKQSARIQEIEILRKEKKNPQRSFNVVFHLSAGCRCK